MRISIWQLTNSTRVGLLVTAMAFGAAQTLSADIVHNDDVIIIGSVAVGFDAVNGENFSFDTVRLKENNLRIGFNDTSNIGGFPTGNWEIRINDSTNGGRSMFAVIDQGSNGTGGTGGTEVFTIEAGARLRALYVESDGDVGFGTNNPVVNLHVVDGNTPTLRLEQDGSSGFTPQTWDVAGNEANFFIRDVTNGSALPFRIFPGTPSSSLFIRSNETTFNEGGGNQDVRIEGDTNTSLFFTDASTDRIGIGTNAPSATLQVVQSGTPIAAPSQTVATFQRSGDAVVSIIASNVNDSLLDFGDTDSAVVGRIDYDHATNGFSFRTNGTDNQFLISSSGTLTCGTATCDRTQWLPASSRELKDNIQAVEREEALAALKQLAPVKFNYKIYPDELSVGFIAEDVPELVARNDRKHLSPMDIVSVVTKVVQDQQTTIEDVTKVVQDQRAMITALSERLEQIERQSQPRD